MANLTKILKSSGALSEISKNEAIRPYLRLQETGELRLLEDGGKRLLENSPTADSTYISKNTETISEISKNSGTPAKILKNTESLTKILKS